MSMRVLEWGSMMLMLMSLTGEESCIAFPRCCWFGTLLMHRLSATRGESLLILARSLMMISRTWSFAPSR